MKREINQLINYKELLQLETRSLEIQTKKTKDKQGNLLKENKSILYYKDWFYKLKYELWNNYNYNLRIEDIGTVANVIISFKNHNYDPYDIIDEYSTHNSLKEQITKKKV